MKYEKAEAKVIMFDSQDIIRTSGCTTWDQKSVDECNEWLQNLRKTCTNSLFKFGSSTTTMNTNNYTTDYFNTTDTTNTADYFSSSGSSAVDTGDYFSESSTSDTTDQFN